DGPSGSAHGVAESPGHGPGTRRSRRERLAREHVGVDGGNPARGQRAGDMALAGREAPGQRDPDHAALVSAAVTVFTSSWAMVRGPTPPGTGVSAPATSATAGCTSPTTRAPRLSKAARRGESGGKSCSTVARSVSRLMPTSTTVAPGFT